jgi:hypothetical protein
MRNVNLLDVLAPRVESSAVVDGANAFGAVQELLEGAARHPHPVAGAHGPIGVEQVLEKVFDSSLPGDPQVAASQEASDHVPGHVVHPALEHQLPHGRVHERVARFALLPALEALGVVVPRNVQADGIPLHLGVVRVQHRHGVEILAPNQLPGYDCT